MPGALGRLGCCHAVDDPVYRGSTLATRFLQSIPCSRRSSWSASARFRASGSFFNGVPIAITGWISIGSRRARSGARPSLVRCAKISCSVARAVSGSRFRPKPRLYLHVRRSHRESRRGREVSLRRCQARWALSGRRPGDARGEHVRFMPGALSPAGGGRGTLRWPLRLRRDRRRHEPRVTARRRGVRRPDPHRPASVLGGRGPGGLRTHRVPAQGVPPAGRCVRHRRSTRRRLRQDRATPANPSCSADPVRARLRC